VSYRLAEPQNLQRLSVSDAERKAGIVEKIRLKDTVEALLLQSDLYSQVNAKYLQKNVFGFDEEKIAESIATELAASEAKSKEGNADGQKVSSEDAAAVSQQLYSLINAHFGNALDSEYGDEDQSSAAQDGAAEEEASDTAQAEDVAVADAEEVTQDEEVASLTEDQCVELQSQKSSVALGDINYCQIYGIDVLDQSAGNTEKTQIKARQAALKQTFADYDQNQFVDDEAFKALWNKHKAEIEQALPKQRNPVAIDVGLDEKGRLVNADYDIAYTPAEFNHRFNIKADMQILNYG
ncbi:hypothetical protein ACSLGU_33340, partial [Acinetobacter sp. A11]